MCPISDSASLVIINEHKMMHICENLPHRSYTHSPDEGHLQVKRWILLWIFLFPDWVIFKVFFLSNGPAWEHEQSVSLNKMRKKYFGFSWNKCVEKHILGMLLLKI